MFPVTKEPLLYEMECFCNNYFNPQNDPNSPIRNRPPSFLELAERIADFNANIKAESGVNNVVSFTNEGYSVTKDLSRSSWQKAFSQELAIYKRVKFL